MACFRLLAPSCVSSCIATLPSRTLLKRPRKRERSIAKHRTVSCHLGTFTPAEPDRSCERWLDAALAGWQAPRRITPAAALLGPDDRADADPAASVPPRLAPGRGVQHEACCSCSGSSWPFPIIQPCSGVVAALRIVSPEWLGMTARPAGARQHSCSVGLSAMPRSTAAHTGGGANFTSRSTPAPARWPPTC